MKVSCDIIRDILPLYAEDMVSNATRDMVDEHLCECDSCTKELGVLKKAEKVPVEVDLTSLKRVGHAIRQRRILTAATAVMTALTVFVTAVVFMMTPYYLTAEEAIEGVELRADGGLAIDRANGYVGCAGWGYKEENHYAHLYHTTRYDWLMGKIEDKKIAAMTQEELEAYIKERFEIEEITQEDWDRFNQVYIEYGTWKTNDGDFIPYNPETCQEGEGEWVYKPADENHWYVNIRDGSAETLIWGSDDTLPTGKLVDASYGFTFLFFGVLVLMLAFMFMARRKSGQTKEILVRLAILCGGILFSTLLVTSGDIIIVDLMADYKWPGYIVVESIFTGLTALLWYQLHVLKKQDKAI
ncbi:MAG: zf-HC2 domain-containing protein [Oscillospiraceae bacterium]|nr:zf-HC2 domain-containing protein [Oscillospiraceae bacterium]